MERQLVSFDWAIKKILRSKANFGILEGFLSELLFDDIQIIDVLESEANQEAEQDKFNRVDIKVKDRHARIILIEVQYSRELDSLHRILYSSSKAVIEHMQQGDAYSNVSKVISISILYFVFGKGDDYIYRGTTQFIGLHNQTELQLTEEQKKLYQVDAIANIYPEHYLIELTNFNDIAKNTLDEWIYFLKNEQIKDEFTAKGLPQAKETLDVLKMDREERGAYERYQQQLHREASLYQSTYGLGRLEGREEKQQEIARNIKSMDIAVEVISQATGLSIDEINNLPAASSKFCCRHQILKVIQRHGIFNLVDFPSFGVITHGVLPCFK